MSEYFKNPNTWTTIIAIIISVCALFQTKKQIQISNKQHLFERRLEKYHLFYTLLNLYKDNLTLANSDDIYEYVQDLFVYLTNCTFLEAIGPAIQNPTESQLHKDYLKKLESLEKYAVECTFIWNNEDGQLISCFIKQYAEFLRSMYKQQTFIKKTEDGKYASLTLEQKQEKLKNEAYKIGLYDTRKLINETFNQIIDNNLIERIQKDIYL